MRNFRFRKGAWVLAPILIMGFISPLAVSAEETPQDTTTTTVESTTTSSTSSTTSSVPEETSTTSSTTTTTPEEEATTTTSTTSSTTTTIVENTGPVPAPDAGFEDGTFAGWSKGTQSGTLGAAISGSGTGVSIFNGSRSFAHPSHPAIGNPIRNGEPNPYYAPAVSAGRWVFSPDNGTYAALLQPKGEQNFNQAMSELGLSNSEVTAIRNQLTADAQAAANGGSATPTDAAWITREVELDAGTIYTMSWNYLGTDYVPFNDGSITALVPVTTESTPVITVNNFERSYALLGFTNPGTGDYSVNSYGATGWQMSTYEVSVSGTYKLGFAAFNLGDTALSPVLMVDNLIGETDRCAQDGTNCESFGGVTPNNETAPTVVPPSTTTTTTSTTTTTTTVAPPTQTTTAPQPQAPVQPQIPPQPVETTTTTIPETTTTTVLENITTTTMPVVTTTKPKVATTTSTTTTIQSTTTVPETTTTILENVTTTTIIVQEQSVEPEIELIESLPIQNIEEVAIEEVKEVFAAIVVENLSEEEINQIVETLNSSDDEIKEVFEEEINVYGGGFDDYVPAGSAIDVGTRKTVIAAAALLSAVTIAPPALPSQPSGGGGSSGPSGGGSPEGRSRREEDGGEPSGEIAGPEEDEDGDYAKNSIYKYYIKDGIEMKKFSWFGFSKKLWDITAGLAFTLAGSFIVYITLSGTTQRLAGIATVIALFVHYINEIRKNDIN